MNFAQRLRTLPLAELRRMVRHPGREWLDGKDAKGCWLRDGKG